MQPARLNRTTSHLAPHLGGVAASIGTLNRAGAYKLARACSSALQTCLSTNMLTQQAFEPLVNHDFCSNKWFNMFWPGTLVEACRVKQYLNHFSHGFARDKQVTGGTKQFWPGKLVQQETSKTKSGSANV
jgi:hypothetical protein